MVDKRLANFDCEDPKEADVSLLSKDLAEDSKKAVRGLNRDSRYKFLIQVISGQNKAIKMKPENCVLVYWYDI